MKIKIRKSPSSRLLFASLMTTLLFLNACSSEKPVFLVKHPKIDLLISNAKVLDGSGSKALLGDIVIVDDSIVYIGKTQFTQEDLNTRVKQHIDAKGRIASPGFIDLHSHGNPLQTPSFENFIAMGITTITLGQDGDSPPVENLQNWLKEIEDKGIGPNLAMFLGHGTLRDISGIKTEANPDEASMDRMLGILDETLKYTFGLSTGLEYSPGLNAGEAELQALAKIVGQNDRLIMSHIRNEDDDQILVSLNELIRQGEHTQIHVSHLKSVYGHESVGAEKILALLKKTRESGISITADLYPYNASYTGISIVFPIWSKTLAQFESAKANRREELETFLRNKVTRRNGPEATLLGTPPYTGKTLADLSRELEMPFEKVLIDIIGPKGASGAYFVMDDALQTRLLSEPTISISSDGRIDGFHPRGHGAFAKIIEEYVVKRGVLSLAEAVRKMTSQSADILNIKDRGLLKVGYKADLVLFNPKNIKALASYPAPHQFAEGFDIVIINGRIVRRNGMMSSEHHGQVLKPQ